MKEQKVFLKLEGILGGSTAPGHSGEIEIYRFRLVSTAEQPLVKFKFIKQIDSTSPILFNKVRNGERIKKGSVTVETSTFDQATHTMKVIQRSKIEMADIDLTGSQLAELDYFKLSRELWLPQVAPGVPRLTVDEITIDVGKIISPNILSLIGSGISSLIGAP